MLLIVFVGNVVWSMFYGSRSFIKLFVIVEEMCIM